MAKRIIGDKVAIDYAGVQRFFDERSANDGLKSKYNYVLFQDDNPKLAIERDNAEKEKVGPVLRGVHLFLISAVVLPAGASISCQMASATPVSTLVVRW